MSQILYPQDAARESFVSVMVLAITLLSSTIQTSPLPQALLVLSKPSSVFALSAIHGIAFMMAWTAGASDAVA